MKSSVFRSAPARVVILSLFASSLAGYVAMVSCSRTVTPAQPAAQPAQPTAQPAQPTAQPTVQPAPPAAQPAPPAANAAPSPVKARFYGGTTKSAVITPPPTTNRESDIGTFYAPATKSDIVFKPQAVPAPQVQQAPAQQVQQAPVQRVQ